jgi:hypothetical protein
MFRFNYRSPFQMFPSTNNNNASQHYLFRRHFWKYVDHKIIDHYSRTASECEDQRKATLMAF